MDTLVADKSQLFLPTYLVTDHRGAGKSTIVRECFKGKESVVHVEPSQSADVDNLLCQVFEQLGVRHIPQGTSRSALFISASKELPTLLVEGNAQCKSKALQEILKRWGDDNQFH